MTALTLVSSTASLTPQQQRRKDANSAGRKAFEEVLSQYSVKSTTNGMPVLNSLVTENQSIELMRGIEQLKTSMDTACRFALGDLWNQIDKNYGDKAKWLRTMCGDDEELFERRYKEYRNYGWVANKWFPDKRGGGYGWTYYKEHKPGEKEGGVLEEKVYEPKVFVGYNCLDKSDTIRVTESPDGAVVVVGYGTDNARVYDVPCRIYPPKKSS